MEEEAIESVCDDIVDQFDFHEVARSHAINLFKQSLCGPMVTHSAAGAKGPGFNSPVARAYLRFISRASILEGKQY